MVEECSNLPRGWRWVKDEQKEVPVQIYEIVKESRITALFNSRGSSVVRPGSRLYVIPEDFLGFGAYILYIAQGQKFKHPVTFHPQVGFAWHILIHITPGLEDEIRESKIKEIHTSLTPAEDYLDQYCQGKINYVLAPCPQSELKNNYSVQHEIKLIERKKSYPFHQEIQNSGLESLYNF